VVQSKGACTVESSQCGVVELLALARVPCHQPLGPPLHCVEVIGSTAAMPQAHHRVAFGMRERRGARAKRDKTGKGIGHNLKNRNPYRITDRMDLHLATAWDKFTTKKCRY
jgi:hypothetical protein